MIEITKGNLLKADAEALVNTVNTVGVMGKGIALQFKKAFPENFNAYKKACDKNEVRTGRMFVFETGEMFNPKYIVNFPTKRHWREKSRLADIETGLKDLAEEVRKRNIMSVAIPPLGCGLGGLNWSDVRLRIEQAFESLSETKVLLFEPAGSPKPREMVNRTKRPKMTHGRAALMGLMNRYLVPGYDYRLSLLEIQKLAYFLQEAGESMRLEFQKHFYGPYTDTLRHVLKRMEGHFIIGYGDGKNKPDTPINLKPDAVEEAETFLKKYPETKKRFERVADLIEGLETPFGMELVSTVHWVCVRETTEAQTDTEKAIRGVHSWHKRKRDLFKSEHIAIAHGRLAEKGWFHSA